MKKNRPFSMAAGFLLMAMFVLTGSPISAQDMMRKSMELRVGGSDLIRTPYPVQRVSIADPDIADVVVLSPRELYIYGKKVGYTSLILWQGEESKTLLDVVVTLDLTSLKEKIHQLYPKEDIQVYASDTGIILSGTVSGPEVVEQVIRLTRTFMPQMGEDGPGGGTGRSGQGITNLLKIGAVQQVLLEVRVAEVTRNWDKELQAGMGLEKLGKDFTGSFGTTNVFTPIENTFINANFPTAIEQSGVFDGTVDGLIQNPGSLLFNFAGNAANIFLDIDNFNLFFRFLESEGLARTLAEPRLVTLSGQEASFLAGGEFPIPVPQDLGEITITFKEFGVSLKFIPVVMSDGKISLRVAPSVSEITSVSIIPAGIQGTNFNVPNLATRRLETTVEMYDGQTLALAGLLQDNFRETIEKIPGLGDIPVLGALFRSSSYRQEKTDLLIAVTPHLVKPVPEGSLQFPGEYFKIPNRYEFYLEGRLEGRRFPEDPSAFKEHSYLEAPLPGDEKGGLEGDFGFRPVAGNQ